ncbi:MAG: hypothetical protein AMXMBFR57_19750 [Acidimicrobiia bacterium]|jgi:SAM-dependent methyltransferase
MEEMLAATADAEERHFWFRGLRRTAHALLIQALGGHAPSLIVDCGAGTGRNLDWLREIGPAVGVELSPTGLAVARRHGRAVAQGSVDHLPIGSGVADVATMFDVLYCLPDDVERAALQEIHRILKPGGVAVFNVAALDLLKGSHSTLTHELRRYTPTMLRRRMTEAGLVVERLTFTNFVTFPLVLASRLRDQLTRRVDTSSTDDLSVPPTPVNAALDVAMRAETLLARRVNLPIGSSLLCVARRPRRT